jgi:hypothetical protein
MIPWASAWYIQVCMTLFAGKIRVIFAVCFMNRMHECSFALPAGVSKDSFVNINQRKKNCYVYANKFKDYYINFSIKNVILLDRHILLINLCVQLCKYHFIVVLISNYNMGNHYHKNSFEPKDSGSPVASGTSLFNACMTSSHILFWSFFPSSPRRIRARLYGLSISMLSQGFVS